METTFPILHPAFVVPTVLGGIAFIGWLIRLESKVAANVRTIERTEGETEKLWTQVDTHEKDMAVHFNEKVSKLVDEKNAVRFKEIEKQLEKIDRKLDRMAAAK